MYPDEIQILQLDNGLKYLGHDLSIPDNVILLFQSPYCSEVNSIEIFWGINQMQQTNFVPYAFWELL